MLQYLLLLDTEKEREFFTSIYKEYRKDMFFVAYSILHNHHDAEDIVHESFLTLVAHLDKLIGNEQYKIWAYIKTTVRHKSYNLRHRKQLLEEVEMDEEWVQEEVMEKGPDLLMEDAELKEIMGGLLKQLKTPYKEVLALQYYHELSVAEIAEELGKTQDNIRHISMRAKKKLQSILAEHGLWDEGRAKKSKAKKGKGKKASCSA